ncbi:glycosyltransferase family 39 protein [Chloroflexi bacterium TSY]|nr:glycosyltransferase family 39 protein [Chloroflexi bacterium TSY]
MQAKRPLLQWLLLVLCLLAYARLVWQLDAKNLWWDESLSLQRAESNVWSLLRGELWMYDGFTAARTIDQHPFLFFLLQSFFVHTAGISEFSLRYVSVMASTLFVPILWTFGRYFVRHAILPYSGPIWSALFGAVSPFYLWYGQEARPYALWALLALLSSYLLVRAIEVNDRKLFWIVGYVFIFIGFLATHYFATFLVPVHMLLLLLWLGRRNWILAISIVSILLLTIGGISWFIAQSLLSGGGGINFRMVATDILLRDLLNAFSMGPSADVGQAWVFALDLLFGLLALLGILWAMRRIQLIANGGWLVPALVIIPTGVLIAIQSVQPVYMNARHMSLIGGGILLAAGSGLGLIWERQRWLAGGLVLLLLFGNGFSTYSYFTQEEYAKDDFTSLGAYFEDHVLPGDVVLINPTFSWRHFDYYLPIPELRTAEAAGAPIAIYGVPLLKKPIEDTYTFLEQLSQQYRRIWMIKSGTHSYLDPEKKVEEWLSELTDYRMIEMVFFSHSTLRAELYYPEVPVYNEPLENIPHQVDVSFGDQIQLIGYDIEPALTSRTHTPLFLYWQISTKTDQRYKYIVRAEEAFGDQWQTLAQTEREPYEGWIPTDLWYPGQTFLEFSDFAPVDGVDLANGLLTGRYRLAVELYNRDSLEKLRIAKARGIGVESSETTVYLSFR